MSDPISRFTSHELATAIVEVSQSTTAPTCRALQTGGCAQRRFADVEPLLFHPYAARWTVAREQRIDRALRRAWRRGGGNLAEHDISAVLGALNPPWEAALISLLCRAAGRPYDPAMQVFTTKEFLDDTRSALGSRRPDFVVGRVCDGVIVADLIVEVKGKAWVNGGFGYCPARPQAYSNQVLCYPHGCWTSVDLAGVSFVWLGMRSTIDDPRTEFPWGSRAVTKHCTAPALVDAYRRQKLVAPRWRALAIEDVADRLRSIGAGGGILADLIDAWLERLE